jgi:hypothetical protein
LRSSKERAEGPADRFYENLQKPWKSEFSQILIWRNCGISMGWCQIKAFVSKDFQIFIWLDHEISKLYNQKNWKSRFFMALSWNSARVFFSSVPFVLPSPHPGPFDPTSAAEGAPGNDAVGKPECPDNVSLNQKLLLGTNARRETPSAANPARAW